MPAGLDNMIKWHKLCVFITCSQPFAHAGRVDYANPYRRTTRPIPPAGNAPWTPGGYGESTRKIVI